MTSKITCPSCNHQFDIEDVLSADLEKKYRDQFNQQAAELRKKEQDFEEKKKKENELFQDRLEKEKQNLALQIKKEQATLFQSQLDLLKKESDEKSSELKSLKQKELDFEQMKKSLREREEQMEIELQKKLAEKEESIRLQAQKMADDKASIKLMEMERVIRQKAEEMELEKQKAMAATANKVRAEVKDEADLKLKEMHKQLEDQKKLIEEMKRKSEQGSMQLQGEVLEMLLEEMLREFFPFDEIGEVGKGVRGADVVQTVRNKFGQPCGKIIYESKRTKNWDESWVDKLKADMISQNADIAVIVTQVMPKELTQFGLRNGVWVCSFSEVKSLALVLREGMLKIHHALKSQENKGDKMVMLYDYLTGNEFRQNISALREGFTAMKMSIQQERNAMEKLWKAREKQLEKVLINATQIDGSISGIAGSAVPEIDLLGSGDFDTSLSE
jgi:hypothetical protein